MKETPERSRSGSDDEQPFLAWGHRGITDLMSGLKHRFEAKRFDELESALALPSVWWHDQPRSVASLLRLAEQELAGAEQVEIAVDRIHKSERTDRTASGSYTCCLMWVETDSWRQHEVHFDFHLGLELDGDHVGVAYAGVTAPTLEEVPFPEDEDDPLVPAPLTGDSEAVAQVARSVARAASSAESQEVLVYVPIWLPADQLDSMLDRSSPDASEARAASRPRKG